MSNAITISGEDILHQLKLSLQVSSVFKRIMSRQIIKSASTEAGIKVETEELQKAADTIRLMNKIPSTDETWAWLQNNYLSLDDFEELVHINVLSEKLAKHLFADKVEPWFVENQLDYVGVVMYEVVLDDKDLAMELFYALQEGEMSFPEVAHQYIQDTELRRTGGYRGIQRRKDLNLKPQISAAVFAAKPPQVLKPIVTSKGFHLIFVESLIQREFDKAIAYEIGANLFSEWLTQQIEQIEVKWAS